MAALHNVAARGLIALVVLTTTFASSETSARAAEPSQSWFATYGRDLYTASVTGDALSNDPRAFNAQSSMYLQSPGWDSSIELRTTVAPVLLYPFPVVTPTPPSLPGLPYVYRWDATASTFQTAFLTDTRPVSAPPGVTLSREMVGGRDLAAGQTVDREFRANIHMIESAPFVSASVVFTPFFVPPGTTPPVVASNVSCPTGSPLSGNPGYFSWSFAAPAAGTDLTIVCTVRLQNVTAAPARYTPQVDVRVERVSTSYPSVIAPAIGTEDPALEALVTYRVAPPPGVVAEARLYRYEALQVGLAAENVADVPVPWSAQFTEQRFLGTSDDVVADAVRPHQLSWQLSMQRPFDWGGGMSVTTALDTSGWFFSPAATSTTGTSPKTYRWEQPGGFLNAFVSSMAFGETRVLVPGQLGASVSRESVGGSSVAAGATVTRAFVVRLVGSTDTTADVSIFIGSGAAGSPAPVTVTGASCTGGTVSGGLPGGFRWTGLALPQGVEVRLDCSAVLTNTATTPAFYKPVVSVSRASQPTVSSSYASEISFTSEPLGSVTFDVSPLAGQQAAGTLLRSTTHQLFMNPLNRAPVATQLSYTGATTAGSGEPVTLSARLTFGTFSIAARTLHFQIDGATYDATTDLTGAASVTLASGIGAVGPHPVTVAFDGDEFFAPSSTIATVQVVARATTLTYTGDNSATFGFAHLSARLVDAASGAPLGGKSVTFTIDGVAAGAAVTDAAGDAVLQTPPLQRLLAGAHAIGVAFAGDSTYAASSATGSLTTRNSAVKVNADGVSNAGPVITLSVKSDGSSTSGDIQITTPGRTITVRSVLGVGVSSDGLTAVVYGRTAAGENVVVVATDAGRSDRIVVRVNDVSLTGDGSLREGSVKIKF